MEVLSLVKEIGIVYIIEEYLGRDPEYKHKELMKEIKERLDYNIDQISFRNTDLYNQLLFIKGNKVKSIIYKEDKYGKLKIETMLFRYNDLFNGCETITTTTFSNYNRKLKSYTQGERSIVRKVKYN